MSPGYATKSIKLVCGPDLDTEIDAVQPGPAVFAVFPRSGGEPYIARTGDLRRRLRRLLRKRERVTSLLNLREVAERIEYWPTGSSLESLLVWYECGRLFLPTTYQHLLKLRFPPYVRLLTTNSFPRTQVSSRLASTGISYGPFRSRALADQFEHDLLDLFQLRRCQEDLQPSPEHPGCIYGEMNMCLRPCQALVSPQEYASEAVRVADFLSSNGRLALQTSRAARDTLSQELEFEAAAKQHERVERIEQLLRLRDDLAHDIARIYGVAVVPSTEARAATLVVFARAAWQIPITFRVEENASVSLDKRLREMLQSVEPMEVSLREQEEHLALLARWYWSSWREGIFIQGDDPFKLSYRRLVTAVSKVVHHSVASTSDGETKGTTATES